MGYLTPGEHERERERRAAAADAATAKQRDAERAQEARDYQEISDLIQQLIAASYPCSSFIEKVVPVPSEQVGNWPTGQLYRLEHKAGIPADVSKRKARRLAERPPIVTIWGVTKVIRCWIILEAKLESDTGIRWPGADLKPEPKYSSMTITEELTVPNAPLVTTRFPHDPPSAHAGLRYFAVGLTHAYPDDCFVPLSSVLLPEERRDVERIRRALKAALGK